MDHKFELVAVVLFTIGLAIYGLYGIYYHEFAEKQFDWIVETFPSFMVFPKKRTHYVWLCKITQPLVLLLLIVGLILILTNKVPTSYSSHKKSGKSQHTLHTSAVQASSEERTERSVEDFVQ